MKRGIFALAFLLTTASTFAQGFKVNAFNADIYLSAEGYFDVVEKYDIEFTEARHGIFRDFITTFDFQDESGDMSKREIYISDIAVPGRTFKTSGIFGKQFGDKMTIRIGDKNTLITGDQQYEIHYRVKNALFFTNDQVQLYWNIKPSGWIAVFNQVNFTVHMPDGATISPDHCFVYAGDAGVSEPSTQFDYDYAGNTFSGKSKETFFSVPGHSVTVLVKLPKSLIQQVDFTPPLWKRYSWLWISGLVLLAIYAYIKARLSANKVIAVTSYYPPNGLDPAMAGVLIDNTTDFRDLTCLLPYWATKGTIRMEEIAKGDRSLLGDLKLTKLHELPPDSAGYAFNFFNKIFTEKDEVLTSSLRGIYGEPIQLLSQKSKQYYGKGNRKLKISVVMLSWLWAFFSISFLPFLVRSYIDIDAGGFAAFVIFNFIFFFVIFPLAFSFISNKLKAKNQQGKAVMPELVGFYQFIKIAEVERIKALLSDDPLYFEKTMPYAVAFNLLKEWTAKFEELMVQAPGWYNSTSGTRFTMSSFTTSFSNSMTVARTAMVTSPSSGSSSHSSGGGSSGGGAGGGGGGSW